MDLRDRIDAGLETKVLDPRDFERCADHLLKALYPALSPITGGTDLGRDADLGELSEGPRLLATIGPPLVNLKRGLSRLMKKGISIRGGVVLATSRSVHGNERERLRAEAKRQGSRLIQVHDRTWLADSLQSDSYWRRRLLGISSELSALVPRPIDLRRYGEDLELVGRAEVLQQVDAGTGDLVIIGPPGIGKTRFLADVDRVAFLETDPDPGRLAEDLDDMRPLMVVVEDAARRRSDLRLLLRMRTEESARDFRIVATAWLDEAEDVLEQLGWPQTLQLELLERQQMDSILQQLGVINYWHRSAILDQAVGRPGWAVVLAQATVDGQSLALFDGQVLTRQVERYLRATGDQAEKERVLAHVAVYDGVAEEDLGTLSRRLEVPLPTLTRVLHATTHNGILERFQRTWRVRPEALRIALIDRWFLASDAPEPMSVLLREYPSDERVLVTACVEAARRGSRRGAEVARARVTTLTAGKPLSAASADMLNLYAELDEDAARWTVNERVIPALLAPETSRSVRSTLRGLLEMIVNRYQVMEAVELLLDEAVTISGDTRDPGHPLRVLGEAAARILPEIGPDPRRRVNIFTAALAWLDRDPTPARWLAVARLMKSVLSPHVGGTWNDPGNPMNFIFAQGVDAATTLTVIGDQLWPEIRDRLEQAPDEALIDIIDVVADWVRIARGLGAFQQAPSRQQQTAAKRIVDDMISALGARTAAAPGLAVRCYRVCGRRANFKNTVPADFLTLTEDSVGTRNWSAQKQRYRLLARRWLKQEPSAVLGRLQAWEQQLRLVGRGQTADWAVLVMLAEEVQDVQPWVEQTVRQGLPAGTAFFHIALSQCQDEQLPGWFHVALANAKLRPGALSAALRPGVPLAIARQAAELLGADDADAIPRGLLERENADEVVALLLRHRVPEVRILAALEIGPPELRRFVLDAEDEAAWEAGIVGCEPNQLSAHFEYELGQALEHIAASKPDRAAEWFRARLAKVGECNLSDAIPHYCREAMGILPTSTKLELLGMMPTHWKRLLFHDGLVGESPDWVLEAVDAAAMTVCDATRALDGVSLEAFKRVAPALIRRGLDPGHALLSLEVGSRGEESGFYAGLLASCNDFTRSDDAELVSIGKLGVRRYALLRDEALAVAHHERVFGL